MRDHRQGMLQGPGGELYSKDITELVQTHCTRHPGSVKRSDKAKARAAAKRAAASRKANR